MVGVVCAETITAEATVNKESTNFLIHGDLTAKQVVIKAVVKRLLHEMPNKLSELF